MNKNDIKRFINLGFLDDENTYSIYGQKVVDKFLELVIKKLNEEGFNHYNQDFIHLNLKGKYYRIIDNKLEVMISEININNDALDLQYLFSKILKEILGLALIEGYKVNNNFNYYYGYIYLNKIRRIYTVKQNSKKAYLQFDIDNIFYSIYEEDSYLSYKVLPMLTIIPLHQNKSGVLSYANKIKDHINFDTYIDDHSISPLEKKKNAINKRMPLIIYVGPKEYKNKLVTIELNENKYQIKYEEINSIDNYLSISLNIKYNNMLKKIYLFEKEVKVIDELAKIVKVNICPTCKIEKYKYFLTPFNRVSKINKCIVCNENINNIVLLKK